jgi:serine protease Do
MSSETKSIAHGALKRETMSMKQSTRMMALGLWLGLGCLPLVAREPARNLEDLARLESKVEEVSRKVLPATVALLSERTGSSGSGVITTQDGLILTAAHVVQGADELLVVFPDGKQVPGKVLGANYSKDIAMVKIAQAGKWPFVEMGASKSLEAGDWVIALGHSAGFDASRPPPVRFGRVVSKGPGNFLTTDCTLIGGDSGGPLFGLDGKIVGIHSSIGQSLTNNNHAGIDGFRDDWDRIYAGETWGELSLNPFANPEMPVLGIGMGMARGVKGVIVQSVVHGSPAAAAGVRAGDVIRSLDGSPIRDGGELLQILAKRQAGDQVKLGLQRDRDNLDMNVTLKRRNELYEAR